jgi:hypothetical protein
MWLALDVPVIKQKINERTSRTDIIAMGRWESG